MKIITLDCLLENANSPNKHSSKTIGEMEITTDLESKDSYLYSKVLIYTLNGFSKSTS